MMRQLSVVAALGLALCAAGCKIDPYSIRGDGGADDAGGDAVVSGDGDVDGAPPCILPGTDEVCNDLDDDCDGVIDNGFDKQNDPVNCGACGVICAAPNANVVCQAGACVLESCQLGFEDLDPGDPGCEYRCPVFPTQPEDCNGIDDDCDGEVDEAVDLPAPPGGLCRTTPGTPCDGVSAVCATRGNPGVTTWYCDYPATVEFDPLIPNGILLDETLCDGEDGDCDGGIDEDFIDLGQACDDGGVGACRDEGVRACDPGDPTATFCDLSVLPDPDPLAPRAEECNGADDNCDGVVDNDGGPDRIIDDMVHITHHGLDFYVYRYEASRPDATATDGGINDGRPCSRPDVLPWSNVTFAQADAACLAVGKRLCTAAEWLAACEGASLRLYPYGGSYDPNTCNGLDLDGIPGGGDDDVLLPTGDPILLASCLTEDGVNDMSGNLREWTDDQRGTTIDGTPIYVVRGGAYHTPFPGLECGFELSQAVADVVLPTIGFRCCSDAAP